jgi:nickel-dependent lactate racemase
MRRILGDDIFSRIDCESHDSEHAANFVSLGKSSFGTPIEINRVALDADIRITVNMLEPHHSAGWSGGAKNIMPGISSSRTVFHHHAHSTNPDVRIGRIEGNPFKEDIDEIGARVGVHFSVDVVMSEKAELLKAFSGDLIRANREGARFARELISVPLTRQADIVIGAVGGAPRDSTLWQAEGKIFTRITPIVRPGGVAILVAEANVRINA